MPALRCLALLACLAGPVSTAARAQVAPPAGPLRVFLDCMFCDEEFVRTEITWVNWVRDRMAADVHVLVTTQVTGGGGIEYTLAFLGLHRYASAGDTLAYAATPTATQDETRRGLIRLIKAGLVPFVARTTLAARLEISVAPPVAGAGAPTAPGQGQRDRWNAWVFTLSANGNFQGDRNNKLNALMGSLNARRTTEEWKANLAASQSYEQTEFTTEQISSTFIQRSYNFTHLVVRSLGPRLSAGERGAVGSSTFENKKFFFRATPAVEFDIFPYSEATRRMLTLQYAAGVEGFQYREETIYGKLDEVHPLHSLSLALSQNQPWGSASIGAESSQYLDLTQRNSASVFVGTNVRLFKGFNVNVGGQYSAIHNQLFLPRRGATEQEILLRQRQLATNYSYFMFLGINYTFGSLLNNVVNPRFGRDGGGMGMMMIF